ncbi:ATP-dependent DNA ligase [Sphingobacterium thalpophilum]|uniref:DNA ligase (ATP) n=1 Tax=Sphingobacterium thalpophilum TaxID=259 RepID=A0ABV4HJI5_9SPHI
MKEFATLIHALDSSNKTNVKKEAIIAFLNQAPDKDKLWLLALMTGKRPKRPVSTKDLRTWALEITDIPEWLFIESYAAVGDLAETLALLLPPPTAASDRSLSEWMDAITRLQQATPAEKKSFVLDSWDALNTVERFIFNKLLGGSFRLGVSAKGLINTIAQHFAVEASVVAHSIMGEWHPDDVEFDKLIGGVYSDTNLSKPYPFCLAYPIEKELEDLGDISAWQAEYKWDGIRGQLIRRGDDTFIWSRGEELVTAQFPEISEALQQWTDSAVLDGEILAFKEGQVLNFSELQKRINRKAVTKILRQEVPVVVYLYDLLELNGTDLRHEPLAYRRKLLEEVYHRNHNTAIQLSPTISSTDWTELRSVQSASRTINSEGLMLKRKDSVYYAGRKKGGWWKWKVDPMSIDAVLIYAQKGSGRRSAHYTDYTFAVRDGDHLVSIAKAYSGLTDKEILEVSRYVKQNSLEKFGPVRTVRPELVFEIAFEGIGYSKRHKSGVALRFPRILRWRRDKKATDIDTLENVKKLIP